VAPVTNVVSEDFVSRTLQNGIGFFELSITRPVIWAYNPDEPNKNKKKIKFL
jgi:hypothetical protein